MPSLEKMRAIRKQQRARAGKVSPLEPKAKKGRSKSKRTGIRDTAKKTQEATAKKKAADAKTPKAKTPKAKTTVKEKAPIKKGSATSNIKKGFGFGPVGVALTAAGLTVGVIKTMTGPGGPWHKPGRVEKQKPFTIYSNEFAPSGPRDTVGRQVAKEEATDISYAPKPNPKNVYKKPKGPLGRQEDAGKSLKMLAEEKAAKTRGVTKPKSKPASVKEAPAANKGVREDYDDWNYVKKAVTQRPPPMGAPEIIKDTRAKNPLAPPVTGTSGDGPEPTPKSAMRESQIRDFKKYNKSNLLGRSIDDALRGFFSFMGTLPKSTDEDKWKNKK